MVHSSCRPSGHPVSPLPLYLPQPGRERRRRSENSGGGGGASSGIDGRRGEETLLHLDAREIDMSTAEKTSATSVFSRKSFVFILFKQFTHHL